jgi:hypothetical protein
VPTADSSLTAGIHTIVATSCHQTSENFLKFCFGYLN